MPWEVPDECLITLCRTCHEKEHEGRDIVTFFRNSPPKIKANTPKKVSKKKSDNTTVKLSKQDKDLQKKYDAIKKKGKLPVSTYKPLTFVSTYKKAKKKKK